MELLKTVRSLCTPAMVYFILSFISILLIAIQNMGNKKKYCVGNFECMVTDKVMVFVAKALYVIFWTFILQLMCNAGYKNLAWLLLLFPYVLLFVMIGFFILGLSFDVVKSIL